MTTEKIPIHEVVSLGSFCGVAEYCRRNGYRKASYPFDWIFTDLKSVASFLENDFSNFFDSNDIVVKCWDAGKNNRHKRFNHHQVCTKNHREYFDRCFERFRCLHKTRGTKLFMAIHNDDIDIDDERSIKSIYESLKRTAGDDFVFVVVNVHKNDVHHKPSSSSSSSSSQKRYEKEEWSDNLYVVRLYTSVFAPAGFMPFESQHDMDIFEAAIHDLFSFTKHEQIISKKSRFTDV